MSIVGKLRQHGFDLNRQGSGTFKGDLTARNFPGISYGRGTVFYVDSVNGSASNTGLSPYSALATIDAAMNKCTAGSGDVIVVHEKHVENIANATALVCDIADVTIMGLGSGSTRPTLSFTATAGSIVVSAANVTFINMIFNADFADVAEAFTPTAKYLTVVGCEFKAASAEKNFISLIDTGTTNNQCDGMTFRDCSWIEPDLATTSMCDIDADIDQLTIEGCYVNLGVNTGDLPALVGVATGKDLTNVKLLNNMVIRLNDANGLLADPDTTTANTGICAGNFVKHADTTGELLITAATSIGFFENYTTAVDDTSGVLLPAADS